MPRVDRIQLSYKLTFQTPFHCGTGLRSGLIDRTVIRDAEGYLYVPGSTLKGALRMHCEGLSRLYEQDDADMLERIASPHNGQIALWNMGLRIPMVARIFGSQHHPGQLFFDDARQSKADKEQYDSQDRRDPQRKGKYQSLQTELFTQVRLDRLTRTAVAGALYNSEFGSKGFTFEGQINGWLECLPIEELNDEPTYSLLLLLAGLHLLERIGGNKSTGKGGCHCTITNLLMNDRTYTDTDWRPWLDHLDVLSSYSSALRKQEEK